VIDVEGDGTGPADVQSEAVTGAGDRNDVFQVAAGFAGQPAGYGSGVLGGSADGQQMPAGGGVSLPR
jgi:hypothetical protein